MTDRELLEMAAKAAGLKSTGWIDKTHDWFQRDGVSYNDSNDCQQLWNPLTDDGDALRLAVMLGILDFSLAVGKLALKETCTITGVAIVRRAIVCAAAEIGKAMTQGDNK